MNILLYVFKQILYLGTYASILVFLLLLVKKMFNKVLSPKWHYYIWVLLLIRLAVPFYPQSSVSIYNLFYIAAEKINLPINTISATIKQNSLPIKETSINGVSDLSEKVETNIQGNNDASVSNTITPKTTSEPNKIQKNNLVITIAAFIWISGIFLLILYTFYINIAFAVKVHKKFVRLKDERVNSILQNCIKIMGIKRPIVLLTSKQARMPSLYGIFNPKILLSEAYIKQLTNAEVKYIFLHELSHYKRKDIAINWIITLLQIVYFFNPFIWYAFYKIHEDCEISCDAEALKYINEVEYQSYGSTIIKLIKLFSESNLIPITAGICKNKSSYKRRIIMISKFKKSKWTNALLALILITVIALVGLSGCKSSDTSASNNNSATLSSLASDTKNTITSTPTSTPLASESTTPAKVSSKVKLYEGTYFDNRRFGDTVLKSSCEIIISNVTDTSFDFTIYQSDAETKEKKVIFLKNTATFVGDGKSAAFYGKNYTLNFSFPNNHNAYPVVTDIKISGFEPLEGKTYVNNGIPGHEFG